MRIKEVLAQKSSNAVFAIEATKSINVAIKEMHEKHVGALLVQSETGEPIGILTDRDIVRFYAEQLGDANQVSVAQIMTENFCVETLDSTTDKAESIMTEQRVRHLPIVDDCEVVGILSIGDLVKAKLQETAVEAKFLRDYLST